MTPIAFPHLRNPRINAYLAAPRGLSQLCHVFHRLLTPKHPPCTLSYLVYLLRSILDYTSRLVFNDPVNFVAEEPSCTGVVEAMGLEPTTPSLQS